MRSGDRAHDLHGAVASGEDAVHRLELGVRVARSRRGAPRPSPSRRARSGRSARSRSRSSARISGTSASGGAPAVLEQARRGAVQRDEVVRRDRGARVVERARARRRARTAAARASRASQSPRARASSVSAVTAAHAPSSCSGPRARVKVWSGWSEKRRTCGSSAASGVAPLTCATQGPGSIVERDVRDRRVRARREATSSAPSSRSSTPRSREARGDAPTRRGRDRSR